MRYFTPRTIQEAFDAYSEGSRIVAGCTDFFPALVRGQEPSAVIDVSGVEGFRGITEDSEGWRIGAATTWTDILSADLPDCFDGLKAAAREVGSIQIQNAGTIAGNICNASPAADGVPPLLTLGAQVETVSPSGRRNLPIEDFITGVRDVDLSDGEFVSLVRIPRPVDRSRSSFRKLGSRKYLVISIVMVAVLAEFDRNGILDEIRIAVGACSPVAQRLRLVEDELTGLKPDQAAIFRTGRQHLNSLSPINDPRGTSSYRLTAVAELCDRAIADVIGLGSGQGG